MVSPDSSDTVPTHRLVEDGACRRRLEIRVSPQEVSGEQRRVARRIARDVRLPGFRKGKVPLDIIRQRFAEDVDKETVEQLAGRHVRAILDDRELEPVASPVLEKHEFDPSGALDLVVLFDVETTFELGEYRGLQARRPDATVPDSDVDEAIESLRQGMARLRTVDDRPARQGDDVVMALHGEHLAGDDAGSTFDRKEITLTVGTDEVHPDLSGALEGTRAGDERQVTITYPDDYRTPGLAGRTIRYTLEVKAVRERQLPDLDDELAREAGSFDTLAALREQVRKDLEVRKARWARERVREGLIRQLLERHPFDVPASLVERETRHRLEELAQQLAAQEVDPSQAGVDWKAEWERQARQVESDLRTTRILDAVARKEGIEVPAEDLEAILDREAKRAKKSVPALRAQWQKEGRLEALERHLRRERTLDFLASVGHIQDESE